MPPPWQGDIIEPFLVSGGATFFIVTNSPPTAFDPQPAGVQLVTSVYVPTGKVGFLKQLRVAPFMPTQLVDPWETSGVANAVTTWRDFDAAPGGPVRPGGRNGVWETPFGWESYFDSQSCGEQPPQWTWQLRLIKGNVAKQVKQPFSLLDVATWFLRPDLAVPLSAYPNGIPGNAPDGIWGPQRMQVIQDDALVTHVLVPEDHSLCLFTQWTQNQFQPISNDGETLTTYGPAVYPLLPSFGQLHGYMQAALRESSTENAKFGWGG
ncbi:MAG: hypothetical protein ACOYD1_12810 [Candidatus Nanopelagicales bacterium]